jgi:hypothetical protein
MIVIGGGVSNIGKRLLDPAFETARERAYTSSYEAVRFTSPTLGRNSGVIGAAAHAFDKSDNPEDGRKRTDDRGQMTMDRGGNERRTFLGQVDTTEVWNNGKNRQCQRKGNIGFRGNRPWRRMSCSTTAALAGPQSLRGLPPGSMKRSNCVTVTNPGI